MSSGAGVVLAEERREEDGEGSDRVTGDGERERTESSDSSEENRSVSGELAQDPPPVTGRFTGHRGPSEPAPGSVAGRCGGADAFNGDNREVVQRKPRRTGGSAQESAAKATDQTKRAKIVATELRMH